MDEEWHCTFDSQCETGDGGADQFRNPNQEMENDTGEVEKLAKQKIEGYRARHHFKASAREHGKPWVQPSTAIRTLDGCYHKFGIKRKSALPTLEREGRRVKLASGGSIATKDLLAAVEGFASSSTRPEDHERSRGGRRDRSPLRTRTGRVRICLSWRDHGECQC